MHMKMTGTGILLGALLISGCVQQGASAPPTANEIKQFRDLETQLWEAWNKRLNPTDAAGFYDKAPGNLYFDFAPMKFTGWDEYQRIAGQSLAGMGGGHAVTKINDDFTVIKGGNDLAVTAFTFHVDFFGPDGEPNGMDARETDVWKKEGDKWLIVHQHMSFPSGGQQPAAAPAQAAPGPTG